MMEISIDELLSENWEDIFRNAASQIPNIKIDNVRKYMELLLDAGCVISMDKHAPILAPPFQSANFSYYNHQGGYSQVIQFAAFDAEPDTFEYENDRCRWILDIQIQSPPPNEVVIATQIEIDSDGLPINDNIHVRRSEIYNHLDDETFQDIYSALVFPVYMAISFMHCKNVELIDEPLTRQQRRMKERKGGIDYKVLDIAPFKKQVRRETQPGESQLQRALHICRGNFATYTEDKPLFGKYTGTYWRPMHVKGNKKKGEVVKDYNIVLDDSE